MVTTPKGIKSARGGLDRRCCVGLLAKALKNINRAKVTEWTRIAGVHSLTN